MYKMLCKLAACGVLSLATIGCQTKAQSGALIGALGGAAIGAAIGDNSHSRAGEGAAIGAGVGVLSGALIGHAMDKDDQRKARESERDYSYERGQQGYGYEPSGPSTHKITKSDIITWTERGVQEEIIIDRIERSGQVFRLTAADQNEMCDAGVSPAVVRSMKDTARRG